MVIYDNRIVCVTDPTTGRLYWYSPLQTLITTASTTPTTSPQIFTNNFANYTGMTNAITSTNCYFDNCTFVNSSTLPTIIWPEWHDSIDPQMPALVRERMEAERARQEQEFLANQELRRLENERVEEAKKRAKEILLEHLTSEQRDMVEKNGWFVIQGGKSKKTYRIKSAGIAGNVEEMDGERVVAKYCCHLNHSYPTHDHHLTQKLMLEWDESEFLRLANKTLVGQRNA